MAPEAQTPLVIPVQITSPVDVGRLLRELDQLNNTLLQAGLRNSEATDLPKLSQLMNKLVEVNKLDLTQEAERQRLVQFLTAVKAKAPVLHVSFSADPAPAFTEKVVTWLRREISPQVLLTVGLQPNIGAGCIVRSTNKQFDFSLRQDFLKKRDLLKQALTPITAPTAEAVAAAAAAAVPVASPVAAAVAPVAVQAEVPA